MPRCFFTLSRRTPQPLERRRPKCLLPSCRSRCHFSWIRSNNVNGGTMNQELTNRLAVLTRLVKRSPMKDLGRTAIMKLAYFLTIVRDVPLGYRFTLYSYGPSDSSVLQDVD